MNKQVPWIFDIQDGFCKALPSDDGRMVIEMGASTPHGDLDGEHMNPSGYVLDYMLAGPQKGTGRTYCIQE